MKPIGVVTVKPTLGIFAQQYNKASHNEADPRNGNYKIIRVKEYIKSKISQKHIRESKDQSRFLEVSSGQLISFQQATKTLIIVGQTVGLMPILGVFNKPPAYVRFKFFSLRFLYSVILLLSQSVVAVICVLRLFQHTLSVRSVGFVSFYISSAVTTWLFIRVAIRWPKLLRELARYKLDEYITPKMKTKCDIAVTVFLVSAIVEHILAEIAALAIVLDCSENYNNFYKKFIEHCFPWASELNFSENVLISVVTQIINVLSTLTWNYSDLFIVCISIYLSSILEGINKKLKITKMKSLSPTFWRLIREDYNQAARLVRAFDNVINGVVFASFATNLFFICLQLFNVLSDGISHKINSGKCPNFPSGPFKGYENVIYFSYSMMFVLLRYLSVSLIAAQVHTWSLAPAPILYNVPSATYSVEVQRFLDQVHHDTVALTGLNFFFVTKSLVLTVAGSIFTYELVLLQYGGNITDHDVSETN